MGRAEGAHAKLARAERHVKVARRLVKSFARRQCTVRNRPNPTTGMVDAVLSLPEPPQAISLVLGDAIHNMRSALDHLVWQLILSNAARPDGTPNQQNMFPLSDTREGFARQVDKLARLRGLAAEPAAIIDGLQPYHRRDTEAGHTTYPLWVLNKLENIDKHRRLAVTAGVAVDSLAHLFIGGELVGEHKRSDERMRDGTVLFSFRPPRLGQPEVDVKGTVRSFVTFDEIDALPENTDAVYILLQILEFIRVRVMKQLEPFVS